MAFSSKQHINLHPRLNRNAILSDQNYNMSHTPSKQVADSQIAYCETFWNLNACKGSGRMNGYCQIKNTDDQN